MNWKYFVAAGAMILLTGTLYAQAPQGWPHCGPGNDPVWNIFIDGTDKSVQWKTHGPNRRFAIYDAGTSSEMTDDLVLDRETGLVWERAPSTLQYNWYEAIDEAFNKTLGGRKGARLPTVEELASLVDENAGPPVLPAGHPFIDIQSRAYWTSTTYAEDMNVAWDVWLLNGQINHLKDKVLNTGLVWAVRGGHGNDGL